MLKMFVGNIPNGSNEEDLKNWIEARGFGVESVEILRDKTTGKPRGFGFVVLTDEGKIDEAISALDRRLMSGRALTVNHAVPLTPKKESKPRKARVGWGT